MRGASGESPAEVGGLALDPAVLAGPVARTLGVPRADVGAWRAERLRAGAGNPTSAGVYRVAGEARVEGLARPWSMVLKALQSPASVGRPDFGDDEDHWNYWLRELRGFESGLLSGLPGGVVAPGFYGATRWPTRAWLWIEDLGDLRRESWTVEQCRLAARHLGRMEGFYLASGALPSEHWLARGMIRQWTLLADSYGQWLPALAAAGGPFQRLEPLVGRSALAALAACLAEPAPLLDALDRLPQTFSHQDANADNLLLRRAADGTTHLLALDWQLMGLAPAGAVVGELVNSLGDDAGPTVWRHEHDVLAAYRSGLREAGADVAEEAIELAYAASSILRQGIFMLVMLGQELAAADSAGGSRSDAGDRFVAGSGNMFARLAELAPRALRLAGG